MQDSRGDRKYGRKNVYTCRRCGGQTITRDVDDGTTPFLIGCRASGREGVCDGLAESSFYRVSAGAPDAVWEWFRPTGSEYRKLNRMMREHVDRGGLDLRRAATGSAESGVPAGYMRDGRGILRRLDTRWVM